MSYKPPLWPKAVFGTMAIGLLAAFFGNLLWHPFKERHFNLVAASCSEAHEHRIAWHDVAAFDARVQRFEARSEQDKAVLGCINRWAGLVISDHVSADDRYPAIEFSTSGQNLAVNPPPRYVRYAYIRPDD